MDRSTHRCHGRHGHAPVLATGTWRCASPGMIAARSTTCASRTSGPMTASATIRSMNSFGVPEDQHGPEVRNLTSGKKATASSEFSSASPRRTPRRGKRHQVVYGRRPGPHWLAVDLGRVCPSAGGSSNTAARAARRGTAIRGTSSSKRAMTARIDRRGLRHGNTANVTDATSISSRAVTCGCTFPRQPA